MGLVGLLRLLNINSTCTFWDIVEALGYCSANHRETGFHGSNSTDSFHSQWNPHSKTDL